jgi:SAM-dependent methyltransferase
MPAQPGRNFSRALEVGPAEELAWLLTVRRLLTTRTFSIVKVARVIKPFVPRPLRPPLRWVRRLILESHRGSSAYRERLQTELANYSAIEQVHDLPAICGYWASKHLVPILAPLGFRNSIELFQRYIVRVCRERQSEVCVILSLGAGNCASEIDIARWLLDNNIQNFRFECLDLNREVLDRAEQAAIAKAVADRFTFDVFDVNTWRPQRHFDIILAIQCLHHFVELELLFDKIYETLHPNGFFVTDDMIGRNGHRRWPEALKFVRQFWEELPKSYRYNHQTRTLETRFENWDCSIDSFEGIRAQDILPLLVKRFYFDVFVGFANIIDIFVDRAFGPNFDPDKEWDRDFIDRVHAVDVRELESGRVKPTHMYAALTKNPVDRPKFHKHLTPEFCVRDPGNLLTRTFRDLFRP